MELGKKVGTAINWLLAAVVGIGVGLIGGAIVSIPAKIEAHNGIYLCVESWKLGLEPESCERLLKAE